MKDADQKEFVDYIQSFFKQAYTYATPYLKRKDEIQMAFDGQIDTRTWSTLSEIYFPLLRTAVNQAVPFVINYLFPSSRFVELIPEDDSITFDTVDRIEQVLENELIYKMKVKRDAVVIAQDAIKFGCGYGEITSSMETHPSRELVRYFEDGEVVDQQARITLSDPVEQLRLRWIPFECVIPTPDGDQMEDPTCVFHLDTIREDQLIAMFEQDAGLPEGDRILTGNAEEIIERTRSGRYDGGMFPIWWIMLQMTGDNNAISKWNQYEDIRKLTQDYADHKAPVLVPILKAYFKNEHVWLANGETIIYHVEGGTQTMARPLIKADSAIDGGNWYAQSDVSASKDVSDGSIQFKNAMMDLLTYHLNPITVYDEMAMATPNKAPEMRPYSKLAVRGRAGDAVSYLAPPALGQGLVSLGQSMEQDLATANGQPLQLGGAGTAGLVRGGGGAFESLMGNAMIREEFLGVLLEMNLMEPVVQQTLLRMQLMDKESFGFMKRGEKEYTKVTTTQSEMRHALGVHVNLKAKLRGGVGQESMALTRYIQVYKDNPWINQQAALLTVNPDTDEAKRLLATDAEVEKNMEQLSKRNNPQGGPAGQTPAEQGLMGGASQAAGVNG